MKFLEATALKLEAERVYDTWRETNAEAIKSRVKAMFAANRNGTPWPEELDRPDTYLVIRKGWINADGRGKYAVLTEDGSVHNWPMGMMITPRGYVAEMTDPEDLRADDWELSVIEDY